MLRLTTLECFPSNILAYVKVLEQYKDYMNTIAIQTKDTSIELKIVGVKILKVLFVSHKSDTLRYVHLILEYLHRHWKPSKTSICTRDIYLLPVYECLSRKLNYEIQVKGEISLQPCANCAKRVYTYSMLHGRDSFILEN